MEWYFYVSSGVDVRNAWYVVAGDPNAVFSCRRLGKWTALLEQTYVFRSVMVLRGLRFFVCSGNGVSRVAASGLKLSFSAFIVAMHRCLKVLSYRQGRLFSRNKMSKFTRSHWIHLILLSSAQHICGSTFKVLQVRTCLKKPVRNFVFEDFDGWIIPIFVCRPFPQ